MSRTPVASRNARLRSAPLRDEVREEEEDDGSEVGSALDEAREKGAITPHPAADRLLL